MKRIIRLTESDLARIVKRVIMEQAVSYDKLIGTCTVTEAGYPLLIEPKHGGVANLVGGGYEGTQIHTKPGAEYPYYGTSSGFAHISIDGKKGFVSATKLSCKVSG